MQSLVSRSFLLSLFLGLMGMSVLGQEARLVLQLGHTEGLSSGAFSPDGRFVLTGSYDNTARLWDVATGSELRIFQGHSEGVKSVAFSPDGRYVLTGSDDYTARLWDVLTGSELRAFHGHSHRVSSVAFSPDGRYVLTGSRDNTARLWDSSSGSELRIFRGHSAEVTSVAFSPDGHYVLTGSWDSTARLWDALSGSELHAFKWHEGKITSVAFSPDSRYVFAGSVNYGSSHGNAARLWDIATLSELSVFQEDSNGVFSVAFSPDGRYVLMDSDYHAAALYDLETGSEVRVFQVQGALETILVQGSSRVSSVTFSPDGRYVITSGADDTARLWDTETGAELRRFRSHSNGVTSAVFSSDGRLALIGSLDNTAQLWDTGVGSVLHTFRGHRNIVTSGTLSPDGRHALTGSDDYTARLWNLTGDSEPRAFLVHSDKVNSVAFSPDGRHILTGSKDHTARLWDTATGGEVRVFYGHKLPVTSVAFSPDGRFVLTGSWDDTARLWDAATGSELRAFHGHSGVVESVTFSPDGRYVLTGGDTSARLWDVLTGSERHVLQGHSAKVWSVAFSPDGRYVLTGSHDNTARLWDSSSGSELRIFRGHSAVVTSVAFSPDGHYVLTASRDSTARLWDTESGHLLATLTSFRNGNWAVVDPTGRFDAGSFELPIPLFWEVSNDPLRPLPLEIFMRDYYTPGLLSRILRGDPLPPLPGIASLNRLQPEVQIVETVPSEGDPSRVDVAVRVASRTERGKSSGAQDLRIFRDGQMVALKEGVLEDGIHWFRRIPLPTQRDKVTLSAYAFNVDRVKSQTSAKDFAYKHPGAQAPRAFLLHIGVNRYTASHCDLQYAVNDAWMLHSSLARRMKDLGKQVIARELVSTQEVSDATKGGVRNAIAEIAGQSLPDDVVFLTFAGHGFTTETGEFYLFPSDITGDCYRVDETMLSRAISAEELSEWLRPLDASEITLILDSCYSAASVQTGDFKPGPLGSRGLGQLAYDKRMRILAASQPDAVAMEDPALRQGLLSYVLTQEGLEQGKADFKPGDGRITVKEWLEYAVERVPDLARKTREEVARRGMKLPEDSRQLQAQVPKLFDYGLSDSLNLQ